MISFVFLLIASVLSSAEYIVRPTGTATIAGAKFSDSDSGNLLFSQWASINDHGHVCSVTMTPHVIGVPITLYMSGDGLDFTAMHIGTFANQRLLLNNRDQIVDRTYDGHVGLWSPNQGMQIVAPYAYLGTVTDLNDSGQVIGRADNRPFLWDNGMFIDMGAKSPFAHNFETLGYLVADIFLDKVNNKGEIAGRLHYGKYNQQKEEIIKIGEKPFFWNGEMHILNCPWIEKKKGRGCELVAMNNIGHILIVNFEEQKSCIWSLEQGICEIWACGKSKIQGVSINDSDVILGYLDFRSNQPVLGKRGHLMPIATLLGHKDLTQLALPYSDSYAVEAIDHPIKINNKGQVLALGRIWGEWHPCIIEPVDTKN